MAFLNKFYCNVCGMEFQTEQEALNCEFKNAKPKPPAFNQGDKVIIKNSYFPQKQIALVSKFCYTKPNQLGRKPHALLYLLILPRIEADKIHSVTTATEEELSKASSA
ncbi:MAG: hypothetical protein NTX82_03710 [Candidatus Parcubacteria bacterium]|nr:hypothetical protein [Candidatus Parcubacteria bacterium]